MSLLSKVVQPVDVEGEPIEIQLLGIGNIIKVTPHIINLFFFQEGGDHKCICFHKIRGEV